MASFITMADDQTQPLLAGDSTASTEQHPSSYRHQRWSWWQALTFSWASPLLSLGSQRQLQQDDLFTLPPNLQPDACGQLLWQTWEQESAAAKKTGRAPSLFRALVAAFGRPLLSLGALKLANDLLNFAGPMLLNALLHHLSSSGGGSGSGSGSVGSSFGGGGSSKSPGSAEAEEVLGVRWRPDEASPLFGYACAALLAGSLVLQAILNAQYSFRQGLVAARLRAAVTTCVFRQALRVNSATLSQIGAGRVQTLMSVDADRVVNLCLSVHELWSLPLQIALALWLLWTQVQYAFLAGLGVVVLLIPANRWLAVRIQAASKEMMAAKDRRVRVMVELLRGIRQVKACAWEGFFSERVGRERRAELAALAVRKYLDALCVYFWAATSLMFSLATFGLYVLLGRQLTAPLVFTSLALFNVLIAPLNAFPWVVNGVVEALVSVKRVAELLACAPAPCLYGPQPPLQPLPTSTSAALPGSSPTVSNASPVSGAASGRLASQGAKQEHGSRPAAIVIRGGTFSWRPVAPGSSSSTGSGSGNCNGDDSGRPPLPQPDNGDTTPGLVPGSVLQPGAGAAPGGGSSSSSSSGVVLSGVDLEVPGGVLVAVTGEVGSGKSSLLGGILGELHRSTGAVAVHGSVAYVSQDPWIQRGSIRDNILFGLPMDPQRYQAVLRACALEQDIACMPGCDLSGVGDLGSRLSGGQRARLALARALYQDREIYLLDDVLASVDSHVAAWLTRHALLGPLLSGKTVLVLTHSRALLAAAHLVVTVERDGRLVAAERQAAAEGGGGGQGAAKEQDGCGEGRGNAAREEKGEGDSSGSAAICDGEASSSFGGQDEDSDEQLVGHEVKDPEQGAAGHSAAQRADEGEEREERAVGHVRLGVYLSYMAASGWGWVAVILTSLVLMQATRNGNDLWLSYWVSHTPAAPAPQHPAASAPDSLCLPALPAPSLPWHPQHQQSWAGRQHQHHQHCYTNHHQQQHYFSLSWCAAELAGGPAGGLLASSVDPQVRFYLGVLLIIAAANTVFTLVRAFSFAKGGMVAAARTHTRLLGTVLHLPVSFFDAHPTGRILNRFSSDVSTVDDSLPFIANILLAMVASLAGIVVVLALTQPMLLALLLVLGVIYRSLQRYYRSTSRELRRLDALARSPIYTAFSEALSGGPTIRAFGVQQQFMASAEAAVGALQRVSLASMGASNWLGLRLQLMAATLAAAVAGAAVMEHQGLLPGTSSSMAAGLVGLSLAYVLPITNILNGLLTSSAETEQEMVAMERLLQYMVLQPQPDTVPQAPSPQTHAAAAAAEAGAEAAEAPPLLLPPGSRANEELAEPLLGKAAARPGSAAGAAGSGLDPGPGWVQRGHVVFSCVWLRYSASGPDVLRGLDLEIQPGEKLGICGRTGAGKSSLVSCLLRLTEISAGRITVDGRDIGQVPLQRLRSAIGLVPQVPFIFHGSVRENVDPLGLHTPEELVSVLQHVQLWVPLCALHRSSQHGSGGASNGGISSSSTSKVATLQDSSSGKLLQAGMGSSSAADAAHVSLDMPTEGAESVLSMQLGEGSIGLSQGQQQLLCLARVLLKRPRLLCLDECTASVDPDTAATMHQVIRQYFQLSTVLEVAHRLGSITDCDRVAVMEAGSVLELGSPAQLMQDPDSLFCRMAQQQARHH